MFPSLSIDVPHVTRNRLSASVVYSIASRAVLSPLPCVPCCARPSPRGVGKKKRSSDLHGAALPLRGRVALRAYPGALEAVGVAANPRLPPAAAHPGVGAGRPVPLHLRRPAVVVADARSHGANRVGIHDGASTVASVMICRFDDGIPASLPPPHSPFQKKRRNKAGDHSPSFSMGGASKTAGAMKRLNGAQLINSGLLAASLVLLIL